MAEHSGEPSHHFERMDGGPAFGSGSSRGDDGLRAEPWPPCCCIAAFIEAALGHYGHRHVHRESLAHAIGTAVGADDPNPWSLPVVADPALSGVTVAHAKLHLPEALRGFDANLAFRHVPFCTITFGLYADVLDQASAQGCVVGVGYDRSVFMGGEGPIRHVARLAICKDRDYASMMDDSTGAPAVETKARWIELERAVYAVDDGFWIVGHGPSLELDLAPPWGWSC